MKSCKLQALPDHAALSVGRHCPVMVAASHLPDQPLFSESPAARSRSAAHPCFSGPMRARSRQSAW